MKLAIFLGSVPLSAFAVVEILRLAWKFYFGCG
jgi:hypothetical protein